MIRNAVILNDTSTRYHHGCVRVMRLLTEGLKRSGLTIAARSPARHDWEKDETFLRALAEADVVVINGEGTLHHGREAGERLLRVATHPATRAPVALVNALWQDNPTAWAEPLKTMALVAARDSASAAAMAQATGREVRWLPDLSLSAPAEPAGPRRDGVLIGDSVRFSARKALARAALALPGARVLPTKTLSGRLWRAPVARALLYRAYMNSWTLSIPPFDLAQSEGDYLAALAAAELHITGRFHGVCLSMLTETPFLALASNASKVERLLKDVGLGRDRLVTAQELTAPPPCAPFRPGEVDAIRAFRSRAAREAETLFTDIAALAGGQT